MAIADAVAFFRVARLDEAIRRELDALQDEVTWEALVKVGARTGFRFDRQELERAHAIDWGMRWARYMPEKTEPPR